LSQTSHKGKQLKGEYKGFWRIRTGDYRVVYRIMQKDVVIIAIGQEKRFINKNR